MVRIAGIIAVAALLLFGGGWLFGVAGRSAVEQERRAMESRAGFAEARAHVLDGRVSLFQSNFGAASQHFDQARAVVATLQTKLREVGDAERAGKLEIALTRVRDAQRLALALDGSAQSAAEEALRALDAASPVTSAPSR